MPRVVMVQPYLAQYQVPLVELVREHLTAAGIDFEIFVDADHPQAGARGDAARLPFVSELPARRVGIGGRRIALRRVWPHVRGADLVILEQALGKPEILRLLAPRGRRPRIALMGHGWIRSRPTNATERRFLDLLTRRADWFFAYTQSGADHVAGIGLSRERITVFNNSTDTRQLRAWANSVTDAELCSERERLGLRSGPTLLFLGALDESKRLDLLIEAGDLLAAREPGLNILVCGAGPLKPQLEQAAATRPFLHLLGPKFGRDKAVIGRLADVMVIPAMVGLVATDAMSLDLAVVTTRGPGHPPEVDYLVDGENAVIVNRAAKALADAIPLGIGVTNTIASDDRVIPSVEQSALAIATGITSALGSRDAEGKGGV